MKIYKNLNNSAINIPHIEKFQFIMNVTNKSEMNGHQINEIHDNS